MATEPIRLRLGENGRVVIPAQVRRELRIKAGDEILLQQEEGGFRMTTRRQRIEEAQKYLRRYVKLGVSVVDELIAERREAARHE